MTKATDRDRRSGSSRHLGLWAVLAAVAAAYLTALSGGLVFDAGPLIADNPALRGFTWDNVRTLLTSPYWFPFANDGLYRPVTMLSYLLNASLFGNGPAPFAYHLTNVLLHLGCVAAVYALALDLTRRPQAAVLAAALFGLHPVTTEAVTNVVGRADVLATLGLVVGLWCHRRGRRVAVVACAVVATFSKETGVLLLPLLLLHDWLRAPSSETRARNLRVYAAVGVVALVFAVARAQVAAHGPLPDERSPVDNPLVEVDALRGRLTAIKVLGRELALLVWPGTLSADYSFDQIPVVRLPPQGWDDWQTLPSLLAIAVVIGGTWWARRAAPAVCFYLSWALLALLPTANLVVVIGALMAERFLYLPLVGFASVVAVGCDRALEAWPARRMLIAGALAVVLCGFGVRTALRNLDWADDITLAQSTVTAVPRSAKAQMGLAGRLFERDPRHERLDAVIAAAERAVAIRGDFQPALMNLGVYYRTAADQAVARGEDPRGWDEKCIATLERARTLDQDANRRYAQHMTAAGRDGNGIPEVGHIEIYENLAQVYRRQRRPADAQAAHEAARGLAPLDPVHYLNMAALRTELGRLDDAAVVLHEALLVAPNEQEIARRLIELYRHMDPSGPSLSTDPSGKTLINFGAPIVHAHACAALRDLTPVMLRANLRQAVGDLQRMLRERCAGM